MLSKKEVIVAVHGKKGGERKKDKESDLLFTFLLPCLYSFVSLPEMTKICFRVWREESLFQCSEFYANSILF